jgi:hypothetical protein
MANSSDYTITTLSESVQQRGFKAGVDGTQAPFLFGGPLGPPNLRGRDTAYVSAEGNPVAPRPPQLPFSINLSRIDVPATAYSASAENEISYISPFLYMEFETSSSTVVSGNQGTYDYLTGTLEKGTGTGDLAPRYVTSDPYSGSYSLEFYNNSDSITETNALNFGTPNENSEWSMITGSFSFALWYYPYSLNNSFGFNALFNHKSLTVGSYEWMIVLGDNSGSNDGPIGFYDPAQSPFWFKYEPQTGDAAIQPNQWNHIVVTVSGTVADDNRKFRAYINGTDLGILGKQENSALILTALTLEYSANKISQQNMTHQKRSSLGNGSGIVPYTN